MKRLIAFLLTGCMLLTTVLADHLLIAPNPMAGNPPILIAPAPIAPAPEEPAVPEEPAADLIAAQTAAEELNALGLFQGTGLDDAGKPIFDLERTLSRQEAVIMLVRLLGKEAEARNSNYPCPFPDVADWAKPYVSYAWVFSLTMGKGDGTFGGEEDATAAQYVTFMLRALGYTTPSNFAWEDALTFSDDLGLTAGQYTDGTAAVTRADAALLSRAALDLHTKSGKLLREAIKSTGTTAAPYKNTNPTFKGQGGSSTTGGIMINNEAGVSTGGWKKALNGATDLDIAANDGKVRVLIIHTHATESYSEADGLTYKDSGNSRTIDEQRNLLRVGQVVTDALNSRGIGTVQIRTMSDYPKYVGAYDRAEVTLKKYLDQYPDVEMIIDIHRDAAGAPLRSLAKVNGFETAQLMFVCGSGFTDWKGHLGIALGIHDLMEQRYPGIMRNLILRSSKYNQYLTPGSLLVEVGADGNTLTEAIYSARLLADGIVDYLLEKN